MSSRDTIERPCGIPPDPSLTHSSRSFEPDSTTRTMFTVRMSKPSSVPFHVFSAVSFSFHLFVIVFQFTDFIPCVFLTEKKEDTKNAIISRLMCRKRTKSENETEKNDLGSVSERSKK